MLVIERIFLGGGAVERILLMRGTEISEWDSQRPQGFFSCMIGGCILTEYIPCFKVPQEQENQRRS